MAIATVAPASTTGTALLLSITRTVENAALAWLGDGALTGVVAVWWLEMHCWRLGKVS
jgi:hypothetical protein